MKQVLLIPLFILASFHLWGQSCKYAKNEIDPFEKKEIVITEYTKVMYPSMKFPVVFLALARIDSTYFVKLKFSLSTSVCFNSAQNELLLMTDDNEVYRLQRATEAVNCTNRDTYAYTGEETYKIERETLLELQNKTLIMIRFYTSESYIESDLSKKNLNKKKGFAFFKDNCKCILK